MNRAQVAFGILTLVFGVGLGHLIYTHPEGLNPDWPMGMALLAAALFVFGGLHVIAAGLDRPGLANAALRAILLCFWAVLNWAAFFSTHIQCLATVSSLGVAVFGWQPSERECLYSLRAIVSGIDMLIVVGFAAFVWQRYRTGQQGSEP
jgi:hypothetical protein